MSNPKIDVADSFNLDFGDYCEIEQRRYGEENEFYKYKVIGRAASNYYRPVPVDARGDYVFGDTTDVVKAICCGVDETIVETFRLQDVRPCPLKKLVYTLESEAREPT